MCVDGKEVQRGAIELDPDVRDWERHGHGENPQYEDVVLHVFFETGPEQFYTRTLNHREVPQVRLELEISEQNRNEIETGWSRARNEIEIIETQSERNGDEIETKWEWNVNEIETKS